MTVLPVTVIADGSTPSRSRLSCAHRRRGEVDARPAAVVSRRLISSGKGL